MTPQIVVEFEDTPGNWVDISADVRGGTITRGRSRELERYQAGKLTLVLSNADRKYDPTYEDGPLFGNLKPNRRLRVTAVFAMVTYPLFFGYVDGFGSDRRGPHENVATITATDGFKVLNKKKLATSAYAQEVTADGPVGWWRLGEPSGSTKLFDSVGAAHLNIASPPGLGGQSLISRESNASITFPDGDFMQSAVGPPVLTTYPLSLECVFRATPAHPLGGGALFGQRNHSSSQVGFIVTEVGGRIDITATSGDGTTDNLRTVATTFNDGQIHHFVFTWDTNQEGHIYIDGVEVANEGAGPDDSTLSGNGDLSGSQFFHVGYQPSVNPTGSMLGSLDEVAVYDHVLSPTRVAAHAEAVATPWNNDTPAGRANRVLDVAAWPAGDRDLDTGASVLQSATLGQTALEHLQKVGESEFGSLFITADGKVRLVERHGLLNKTPVATFGDGPGEIGYRSLAPLFDESTIKNPATVSRLEGVAQRVEDTDGTDEFLANDYTLDGLLYDSDDLSLSAAHHIVAEYGQPKRRIVSLLLGPAETGAENNLHPQMLGRDLTDWLTVKERPQGVGDPIAEVSIIEGIQHNWSPGTFTTRWSLSPALSAPRWQIGRPGYSEIGLTTKVTF